ncbi:hypothetical protein DERP_001629 [Dermatophagoides pteronyssinus]|uniref:Uncharacterized protein n=1 Tax=Dermatophagoides pteronyssinus TaxID=6956 RepID=A0ABQ8JB32_DERPT|nr:hypothetical protein DERP_001629 [Dermatophagoides pteronyssinus]
MDAIKWKEKILFLNTYFSCCMMRFSATACLCFNLINKKNEIIDIGEQTREQKKNQVKLSLCIQS